MSVQEWTILQNKIKQSEKLKSEIDSLNQKLFSNINDKTFDVDGIECYIYYISLEHNFLNLHPIEYKGTRLDYISQKQMSITEFFEQYDGLVVQK